MRGAGEDAAAIGQALAHAAQRDGFALVREAALRSLVQHDPAAARAVLTTVARDDEEPRLRELANSLLKTK
jgi:hypothetical protein